MSMFEHTLTLDLVVNGILVAVLLVLAVNCFLDHYGKDHRSFLFFTHWVMHTILYIVSCSCYEIAVARPGPKWLIELLVVVTLLFMSLLYLSVAGWVTCLIQEKCDVPLVVREIALAFPCIVEIGYYIGTWISTGVLGLGDDPEIPLLLYGTYDILMGMYLLFMNGVLLYYRKALGTKDTLFILGVFDIPAILAFFQDFWEYIPQLIAVTLSILVVYLHVWRERKQAVVERELELSNARMEVMVAQIQPHFLYNALATASGLCLEDPEKAAETINRFGKYLRTNLESLRLTEPVPFSKELEHVKTYLLLEQARFGDNLKVEYSIECEDFLIPVLTVQPLAENAVKHGLAENGKKGTIRISTREKDDAWLVEVQDDGCGFDPEKKKSSGVHFGLDNVSGRLKMMVGGTMTIRSSSGEGTDILITIPKQRPVQSLTTEK